MFHQKKTFSATDLAQLSRCNLAMQKRDNKILQRLLKKHKVMPRHPLYKKYNPEEIKDMGFFKKDKKTKDKNQNQNENIYKAGQAGLEIHNQVDQNFKKFNKNFEKNQPKLKYEVKHSYKYKGGLSQREYQKRLETIGIVILAIGLLVFVYWDKLKPFIEPFLGEL